MSDIIFRDWPVDQINVLPPPVDDYVFDGNHLALVVRGFVRSRMALAELLAREEEKERTDSGGQFRLSGTERA